MTKTVAEKGLVWRDCFDIGVDFIDSEHREILSILRCIGQAVCDGNLCECAKASDTLINAAKEHFRHEEKYLEEVDFPRLAEHKKYHIELLEQAEHVKEICEGDRNKHSLKECFDIMESFLIDDVLRGDIDFKSYLEYNGYISR